MNNSIDVQSDNKIPFVIYILSFGIFAMVTSEFQISGMVNVMASDLNVSISQIGYLVSIYAFAMAIGGPLLTAIFLKKNPKTVLIILFILFIIGESLGAISQSYHLLVIARLITGAVSGAFFGTAIAICVQLVNERNRGWATSIVLSGIMIGTVIGLPLANVIGDNLGWRESFWLTAGLAFIGLILSIINIPKISQLDSLHFKEELQAFKKSKLWWVFLTSFLIIGGTFAAFTYFTPILKNNSGFSNSSITTLLFIYGVATVVGNTVVGKFADKYTIPVLSIGLILLFVFMVIFALGSHDQILTIISLVGIGLVGVTMNPAMVTRVMKTANGRPLVNTVHTSVITLGTMCGSLLGGLFINTELGLAAPLWIGAIMALLGFFTIVPEFKHQKVSYLAQIEKGKTNENTQR